MHVDKVSRKIMPRRTHGARLRPSKKSNLGERKLKCLEAKMSWNQIQRGGWLAQDYYELYVAHHN